MATRWAWQARGTYRAPNTRDPHLKILHKGLPKYTQAWNSKGKMCLKAMRYSDMFYWLYLLHSMLGLLLQISEACFFILHYHFTGFVLPIQYNLYKFAAIVEPDASFPDVLVPNTFIEFQIEQMKPFENFTGSL